MLLQHTHPIASSLDCCTVTNNSISLINSYITDLDISDTHPAEERDDSPMQLMRPSPHWTKLLKLQRLLKLNCLWSTMKPLLESAPIFNQGFKPQTYCFLPRYIGVVYVPLPVQLNRKHQLPWNVQVTKTKKGSSVVAPKTKGSKAKNPMKIPKKIS